MPSLGPLVKLPVMRKGQHPLTLLILRTVVPGQGGFRWGKNCLRMPGYWDVCLVISQLNSFHIRRKLLHKQNFEKKNRKKNHLQVLKYLVILEHSVVQITVKVTKLYVYSYY